MSTDSKTYYTLNFDPERTISTDDESCKQLVASIKEKNQPCFYDRRNGVYCILPTFDWEMYYNYLMFLNTHHTEWKGQGYFDCGLIPFIMVPSFLSDIEKAGVSDANELIHNRLLKFAKRTTGVSPISVSSVSLLLPKAIGYDYWIFRDSLKPLINEVMKVYPDVPYLGSLEESELRLSDFIRYLRDITYAYHRDPIREDGKII